MTHFIWARNVNEPRALIIKEGLPEMKMKTAKPIKCGFKALPNSADIFLYTL